MSVELGCCCLMTCGRSCEIRLCTPLALSPLRNWVPSFTRCRSFVVGQLAFNQIGVVAIAAGKPMPRQRVPPLFAPSRPGSDKTNDVGEQCFPPLQIEQESSAIATAGKVHRIGRFAGLFCLFVREVFLRPINRCALFFQELVVQAVKLFQPAPALKSAEIGCKAESELCLNVFSAADANSTARKSKSWSSMCG